MSKVLSMIQHLLTTRSIGIVAPHTKNIGVLLSTDELDKILFKY